MVCDIMLEKPLGVFLPGEEVKGIAQYNFETAKTVRGKYVWGRERWEHRSKIIMLQVSV